MVMPKGRGQVIFRMKEVEVVSQLIDGTFPDYQQIIPRSYKSRTILSTPALLKACKQAEIFAREGSTWPAWISSLPATWNQARWKSPPSPKRPARTRRL